MSTKNQIDEFLKNKFTDIQEKFKAELSYPMAEELYMGISWGIGDVDGRPNLLWKPESISVLPANVQIEALKAFREANNLQ